jgi:hypothetical protein
LSSIPPTAPHSSSTGAGTIGHLVASVIVDSVPLHPKKQKDNTFTTSKYTVLYTTSDLNSIIVALVFNVCYRSEVKMAQNNGDFPAKECRAVIKYNFLKGN